MRLKTNQMARQLITVSEKLVTKYTAKDFFKTYMLSADFIISISLAVVFCFILPTYLKMTFTSTVYNMGITVLSILFSVFFAVLAIIMTATENEFISFLEEEKMYSTLMSSFKFVLLVLFVSLVYSISLYIGNDYYIKVDGENSLQHKSLAIVFQILFTYSLIATTQCILDTLKFTSIRIRYVVLQESKRRHKEKREKELQH